MHEDSRSIIVSPQVDSKDMQGGHVSMEILASSAMHTTLYSWSNTQPDSKTTT